MFLITNKYKATKEKYLDLKILFKYILINMVNNKITTILSKQDQKQIQKNLINKISLNKLLIY